MSEFSDQPSDVVESHPHAAPGNASDVLPGAPVAPPSRRRGRWLALGAGAGAVMVVAAGGVAVGMSLSGGGAQPEDLVPASAVAYFDVDLDPSAGQKVDAVRFLRHFPSADETLGDAGDLRSLLARAFTGSSVDYATQIQPWLGSRYGVAVVPAGSVGGPTVEAVLQVRDEDAARQDLPRILPAGAEFMVSDGFAVITSGPASATSLVSQAHAHSLAKSARFTQALAPYGDGVASFYVDVPAVRDLANSALPGGLGGALDGPLAGQSITGVLAGVVKFEPDSVEVLAGAPTAGHSVAPVSTMSTLPATTVGAIGVSGYGDSVAKMWGPLVQRLAQATGTSPEGETARLEHRYRVKLPDDLVAMLGSQFSLSVDSRGLAGYPLFGYRALTDPAAAASGLAATQRLLRQAHVSVSTATNDDSVVLASTPGYAQQLAQADGTLGSEPTFRSAVPDADGASAVLYVDLASILRAVGFADPNVTPLNSVGATVHDEGGKATFRLRVTVDGG